MELNLYSVPHTKINSKYIKHIKIRAETIKFSEENTQLNEKKNSLNQRGEELNKKFSR